MHVLITLFVIGAILMVAVSVFQLVMTFVVMAVMAPVMGVVWLVKKLRN